MHPVNCIYFEIFLSKIYCYCCFLKKQNITLMKVQIKSNRTNLHLHRLQSLNLRATFRTGEVHVGYGVAFHAVVAEGVAAADGVRHGWPLPAEGAFGTVGCFRGFAAVALERREQRPNAGFQSSCVDEGEEEDEELGKAVPEQLAVHVLKADVADALGPAKNGSHPQEPFAQGGEPSLLKEDKEVEEAGHFGEAAEEGERVPGFVNGGFGGAVEEQAVRPLFKPLLSNGAQGEPQLLPPTHRLVPLGLREIVLVSDVEQGLPHRGTLGIDGEPPQKEL